MKYQRMRVGGGLLLAALLAMPAAQAAAVRVEFTLAITAHDTLAGSEEFEVPLPGQLSLEFDPTWERTESYGDAGQTTDVFMVGDNRFTSSLTPLMPWSPPSALPNDDPRNLAVLTNSGLDQFSYMYFDDQYRAFDGAIDHLYRVSLSSNAPGNSNPYIGNILDYRTPELLGYLHDLMINDEPLIFNERAFMFDVNAQAYTAWDSYEARAYVTSITGDGVTPLPESGVGVQQVPLANSAFLSVLSGLLGCIGLVQAACAGRR